MSTELQHIFFAHSPITYSIARAISRQLPESACSLIGARGLRGPAFQRSVFDDGVWSIPRSIDVLQSISELGQGCEISLCLPHTSFLVGALVRRCKAVRHLFYLEEGLTSADAKLQGAFYPPGTLDVDDLLQQLKSAGLTESLGIAEADVLAINHLPVVPYDINSANYRGAYACSGDAFPGMPNVRLVHLDVRSEMTDARVLSFGGLINQVGYNVEVLKHCLDRIVAITHERQRDTGGGRVLVKLHPRDACSFQVELFRELRAIGADYSQFCNEHGIDEFAEPALARFRHYEIFGPSAQAKYVRQFLGPEALTLRQTILQPC